MTLLTLAEAKAELNITTPNSDDVLQGYIDGAIEAVEFICGLAETASVTEVAYVTGNAISLQQTPVVSVQTISGEQAGNLTVSNFNLSGNSGVLTAKQVIQPLLWDAYTVTYTTGRASAPSSMKQAALVIVDHQWNTRQRGPKGRAAVQDDTTTVPGLGFAIPNAALQMLRPNDQGPALG